MVEDYVPTGIPGVDKILAEKGIPKGHTILVSGGPGSGKTTFAIQFLYIGATQHNESGVYVTLDEEPNDIKKLNGKCSFPTSRPPTDQDRVPSWNSFLCKNLIHTRNACWNITFRHYLTPLFSKQVNSRSMSI